MPLRFVRPAIVALAALLATPLAAQDVSLAGAYLAAERARAAGDFNEAADNYLRALQVDEGNPILMREALISLGAMGRWDEATPLAAELRDDGAAREVANTVLLIHQIRNLNYEAALEAIQDNRGTGPLADGLVAGWMQLGAADIDAAITQFEAEATGGVLTELAHYQSALAYAVAGDFASADQILSGQRYGTVEVRPRGIRAHAQILVQLDRPEDAIELLNAALAQGANPGFTDLIARIEADPDLPFTFIRNPAEGAAEVFHELAAALPEEAGLILPLIYARAAAVLAPENSEARFLAGQLLAEQERYELAIAAYETIPEDSPAYRPAAMGMANAYVRLDQTDRALEVNIAAAERFPDDATLQANLGDILRQAERFAEAAEAYESAIALIDRDDPRYWFLFFARGVTYDNTDRWDEAEADFRHALELAPGQPTVLNYLGYALVEQRRNLDEALEMIEQAVEARPRSGYIVDSLGWVLYRLGRYEEAVEPMERAVELLPTDSILNDHLGDVYWMVGREREARFQWERALSFDPEPEEAERIRMKLDIGLDAVLDREAAEGITQ